MASPIFPVIASAYEIRLYTVIAQPAPTNILLVPENPWRWSLNFSCIDPTLTALLTTSVTAPTPWTYRIGGAIPNLTFLFKDHPYLVGRNWFVHTLGAPVEVACLEEYYYPQG